MDTSINNVLVNKTNRLQFLPIVLSVVIIAVFWQWYFATVDNQWLVDNMISSQVIADDLGSNETEMLSSIINPSFLKLSTMSGELVGLLVALVMLSAYVTLFSRFAMPKDQQISMTQATNIGAKASLCVAGIYLLQAVYILLSPEYKVDLHQVDFLTLNNLLLMLPQSNAFFTLANAISGSSLLFVGLCAYFLHKTVGYSLQRSVLLYLAPYACIWSIMFIAAVI